MRDIWRIPRILTLVRKIWNKNPDLRFGQLISNIVNIDREYTPYTKLDDIFYLEDIELENKLKKVLEKGWEKQ